MLVRKIKPPKGKHFNCIPKPPPPPPPSVSGKKTQNGEKRCWKFLWAIITVGLVSKWKHKPRQQRDGGKWNINEKRRPTRVPGVSHDDEDRRKTGSEGQKYGKV